MSLTPNDLLEENQFNKIAEEYVSRSESFIDEYLRENYLTLIQDGKVSISERELSKSVLRSTKKIKDCDIIPCLIRKILLEKLAEIYSKWRISYSYSARRIQFSIAPEEAIEEINDNLLSPPVGPSEEISNRSDILDISMDDTNLGNELDIVIE